MKTDKVVLDTNIFVSLIISKNLDLLVTWYKDCGVTIYVCPELIAEVKDVLSRDRIKVLLTEPVSAYLRFIKAVTTETEIDLRFDRAPDIKDNYLFDLAYTVKSHYLVTRDKPLLNMKQVNKIKLISLSDWVKLISA
ncbi:MAG TPA: putative toxin-antitoxin system toxin component, PIN family [Chitinophagales bacterium]|nr:putative toxin-antitoxin system toxin component, PIN family [Chitinophagales bacterium]